jgi:hypothetical protein
VLPDEDVLRDTIRTFVDRGVAFTIAADGPEMMRTHLQDDFELLIGIQAFAYDDASNVNPHGQSFRSYIEGCKTPNTPRGQ